MITTLILIGITAKKHTGNIAAEGCLQGATLGRQEVIIATHLSHAPRRTLDAAKRARLSTLSTTGF